MFPKYADGELSFWEKAQQDKIDEAAKTMDELIGVLKGRDTRTNIKRLQEELE